MSAPRLDLLSPLASGWIDEGVARTMVLLVARRGRIVFHRAFGRIAEAMDSPATPLNAVFPTASVGKVVTATAVMMLVEEGRVGLNRPVVSYLPEFLGENKESVLVRHLLTHASGLVDADVSKYAKGQEGHVPLPEREATTHPLLQKYLASRYSAPLTYAPGATMSYSSYSYELLGEIVRRASGQSVESFLRTRIFVPLGMRETWGYRKDVPPNLKVSNPPVPGAPPDPDELAWENEELHWGSGGVNTTARDLAIFGQMFLNGGAYGEVRLLSPASVAQMTVDQLPGIEARHFGQVFKEATWGFGWSVHGNKTGWAGGLYSPESYEHWGSGGNYVWADPRYEIVGVYLSAATDYDSIDEFFQKSLRNDLFTDVVTAAVTDG